MATPERLLVSALLLHKCKDILIKKGMTSDNISRYEDEMAYLTQPGVLPSEKTFLAKFPRFKIVKVPRSDVEFLIKECLNNKVREDFVKIMRSITDEVRGSKDIPKVAQKMERELRKINSQLSGTVDIDVMDDLKGFFDRYKEKRKKARTGETIGISYGFPGVDLITGGMHATELISIIARLGVGKTWILCKLCAAALVSKRDAAFFSLEMNVDSIASRIFSILCYDLRKGDKNLSSILFNDQLNLGRMTTKKVERLIGDLSKIIDNKLWVPEIRGKFSIEDAGRKIEALQPGIAFFDYFGLAVTDGGKVDNWMNASAASNTAKGIARTYGIPFVMAAQLNRTGATSPRMEHIGLTDSIGQDSDKAYILTENSRKTRITFDCQKFRGGRDSWKLEIRWDVNKGRIEEDHMKDNNANEEEDD